MTSSDYYFYTTKALWTMINHICFIGFYRLNMSTVYIPSRGSVSLRTMHYARFKRARVYFICQNQCHSLHPYAFTHTHARTAVALAKTRPSTKLLSSSYHIVPTIAARDSSILMNCVLVICNLNDRQNFHPCNNSFLSFHNCTCRAKFL